MQLEETNDGYIIIRPEQNEIFDMNELKRMNSCRYILPSLRDRYDQDVILYYCGEYISLAKFFNEQILDGTMLTNIIFTCMDCYRNIGSMGYNQANILPELEHIFINPRTKELRVIFCPVNHVIDQNSFSTLLRKVAYGVRTKDAAYLVGTLIEESNQNVIQIDELRRRIERGQAGGERVRMNEQPQAAPQPSQSTAEIQQILIKEESKMTSIIKKRVTIVGLLSIAAYTVGAIGYPLIMKYAMDDSSYDLTTKELVPYLIATGVALFVWLIMYIKDAGITSYNPMSVTTTQSSGNMTQMNQSRNQNQSMNQNTNTQPMYSNNSNETMNNNLSHVENTRVKRDRTVAPVQPERVKMNQTPASVETTATVERGNKGKAGETTVLSNNGMGSCPYLQEKGKTSIMDRIFIDKDEFIIGRENEGTNYRINDPAISKQHAKLVKKAGEIYVTDLNSSNHTYVNGIAIQPNKEQLLQDNAEIRFGRTLFIYYRGN